MLSQYSFLWIVFANLERNKLNLFLPHLESYFNLVPLFKIFKNIFRQILKACHCLMLNPSCDINQWCKIETLKNKIKKIVALGQHMNSLPFVKFCIDIINFYIHIFVLKYENITPIKIFIVENIEIF